MKHLVPLLTLALLASCAATRQAQADLESQLLDVKNVTEELRQATLVGATQEELDALDARLQTEIAEAKEAAERVPDAVKEDVAAAKEGVAQWVDRGTEGGIAAILLTGLSWFLRDRRKKLGTDPLQRTNVKTPPTT